MRVLGVDPGLTRCGLAVVEGCVGRPPKLVAVDVVRTPRGSDIAARLVQLSMVIEAWIDSYRPAAVAIEEVFSQRNVKTVMGTAQVSGVALVAAGRRGVPVATHTPSEVKAAVTGNGRADKAQVTTMVTRVLKLSERPAPPDAADALALAICQIWRGAATTQLEAAKRAIMAGTVRSGR